ncbi:hypothetical protein [Ectobacillus ponti]|uniref:Copper chaperone NosL n=1 Tax=Ectobacillus ponti TaxID=2961894 RepID=A0AA41XC82_9BACI|nr:hypothetical protein [Ectobacillus ponti]MCP8971013.1 hypothetical protein [Ectobacillus ponti]
MRGKLPIQSSVFLVVAAGCIGASLYFPWWGMNFVAPQYPEGLDVIVYPTKMAGNIDIINGLNHYIGMKPFSEESFPELTYLPYLIGSMAAFVLLAAVLRKSGVLYGLMGLFLVGGALGIYDIHRWLKDFGTNLDPKAPIHIQPFVPPVLGENHLANFITHSYFTTGSYLVGAAFLLMATAVWAGRRI